MNDQAAPSEEIKAIAGFRTLNIKPHLSRPFRHRICTKMEATIVSEVGSGHARPSKTINR